VGLILTTYISSADTTPEILLSDKLQALIRKYNQSSATLPCSMKKIIHFGASHEVGNKHNILS
jgi:hypothetical protein